MSALSNTLYRGICHMTLTDPDVMAECDTLDKSSMFFTFFALLLQFVLIIVLMGNTLNLMTDARTAYSLGVLVALIILALEVRMIASDWTPAGILAPARRPPSTYLRLVFRLTLAVGLAHVYAIGAEFLLQRDAIEYQLVSNQRAQNAEIFARVDAKGDDLRVSAENARSAFNARQNHWQQVRADRVALDKKLTELAMQITETKAQMESEEQGLHGRPPGRGPRWREHKLKLDSQTARKVILQQKLATIKEHLTELEAPLIEAKRALAKRESAIASFDRDALAQGNAGYQQPHHDILSRYLALQAIHQDSVNGDAAQRLSITIQLFFILLELAPMLSKVLFSHANNYHPRLAAIKQISAARTRADHRRELQGINEELLMRRPPEVIDIRSRDATYQRGSGNRSDADQTQRDLADSSAY